MWAATAVSAALRGSSRPWVRCLRTLAVSWSRSLMFSWLFLGIFTLASSVGCWLEVVEVYPWLSSLRGFAVEGVDLVLYQVLVGLPSWGCCASRLLGHLSQVGSVLILHPGYLFSGLVERRAFHRVLSPLSSFGMWSPFRVISFFCHY